MNDLLKSRWKISDQAMANMVGDEVVVLNLADGYYYGLDPVGAILWEALRQGRTPQDACQEILARFEVDDTTLQQDLARLLAELADNGLVVRA